MSEGRSCSSKFRTKEVQIIAMDCIEEGDQILASNEVWIKEEPMSESSSCSRDSKERGGFTQKSNLKRHYGLHFAVKPFSCDICGKSYTDNYTYQVHRMIHTGEKHNCDICHRGFTQKSNLKRHRKTHEKEKNYHFCLKCPKKFRREDKLEKHELTHLKNFNK
ncbi:zinc finger protein 227 [Caerostris extrusa]|uniref:Zinc finger protein 227 n=1 Tax=Caerostris extrusa TaxID=172846 RepID=A0AAV4VAD2_CAEEX|nr:zinc finger protein 227 [Caerostris extrusa]